MRVCIAVLTCLFACIANITIAQSDSAQAPQSSKKDPTVLIGEFEYAVSSLGKSTLGEVAGRDTLQTIATFISERQPLEPKHVQLLEKHRDDLVHLLTDESRKVESALLLMWMNKQSGKADDELIQYFAGIEQGRFNRAFRVVDPLGLRFYETFKKVIAARRLSGYHDASRAYADRESLDEKFDPYTIDNFDSFKIGDRNSRVESFPDYRDFQRNFPEPMLRLRDRENRLRENLSPEARVDFKAALNVILDDAQTIQVRKSKVAVILWEIVDFPNLEQAKVDMLIDARDQLVNLFKHPQAEPEIRGMLASLLMWTNDHAKVQCVDCVEAMKSLSPLEFNLVMMYAPKLRLQSSKPFQQIVIDQFLRCDEDRAQMIIDAVQRYVDADEIDFVTAFDLAAQFKDRSQISATQLKQLLAILVDLKAKEVAEEESFEVQDPRTSETRLKIEQLELKRKELNAQWDKLNSELNDLEQGR